MIRLQDVAEQLGVSRTTVSNVIHGKTKKVSKETIERITKYLDQEGYVPNPGTRVLANTRSHIIGIVIGYEESHGLNVLQDPFVSEFIGAVEKEAERLGYYIMLIVGNNIKKIVDIASPWSVDGLIILGLRAEEFKALHKEMNKPFVLIDIYTDSKLSYVNIGIDDFTGGFLIGEYLYKQGFHKALFLAENEIGSDYYRWLGFKQAMEKQGAYCSKARRLLISKNKDIRFAQYRKWIAEFIHVGAIAFTSDYNAIEAMNYFIDLGIDIPSQISITGFDDNMYATLVRPKLTTVKQDVEAKGATAMQKLDAIIRNESVVNETIKMPVELKIRDSVKMSIRQRK
ncbi:LacI family DNA-binding transcriptional regulator [Anaerosporobacter faecicola]|uniref:LacI family DNA-binding transcriptional regulator n=1 Tax=Anaerosporobacter faecicola TaxID=2718714 RepID=UPI00143B4C57|nr:LacI family DNA-binding transcriptional regulator [Anaerosporobacter faecicola]